MSTKPQDRQSVEPQDRRNVPWPLKLTRRENAALVLVAQVEKSTPQDLIRVRSLNDVVKEYNRLVRRVEATG